MGRRPGIMESITLTGRPFFLPKLLPVGNSLSESITLTGRPFFLPRGEVRPCAEIFTGLP